MTALDNYHGSVIEAERASLLGEGERIKFDRALKTGNESETGQSVKRAHLIDGLIDEAQFVVKICRDDAASWLKDDVAATHECDARLKKLHESHESVAELTDHAH